ncbi:MAG: ATP synthase subunit I [Gammaproteobacteria bacterium]|nr:hypothetical protein [Rhodocyclaceae bacterium]MBU3907771.1 ATP synthase subunit I [Gammaproteobacteria bacterium]MBU3989948.1 ATP synthase subunit I [Gammaproteobacteria bacterium]MBU4004417.1 ATP synthase subunit I [Gammaproteobacteria bacterium]MBU4019826.1 ATP synthase subunit I [Gammaproteobacteria bacterium]
MFKILLLQAAVILAVAAVAGLLAGSGGARPAAISALAGGAAYFLPNLLFVLRLRLAMATSATQRAGAAGFLIGEAVKLSAVIALLLFLPRMIDVNWPALIAGLFAVLFVNLFALLLKT